eukprot:TRINITY_DN16797_c0_g1_i1.p1 TRINITY_DN16797_c0_g1~~TRINITY_DN16797_c0_g1_i1.p1  ORF type:complete len:455 (-),score=96.14 TRINITY_DN16797_c0_g1_i1:41-1366(-)
MKLVFLLVSLLFITITFGAGCNSKVPDYGNPNNYPINNYESNMVLINTTTNGKVYQITVPNNGGNSTSTFYLTHVYGTPYQWGVAQGTLLKAPMTKFLTTVWGYFESQVEEVIKWMPSWLAKMISDLGLDVALDLTYDLTKGYTNPIFYQEIQGLSDATGVDYKLIVRVHMIAGLTQGKCSMMGAWGPALDPSWSGKLLQFRALDWDMDGPFRDFSAITVYHPVNETYGHAFANIGMLGFVGGLTGVSETKLGISEIGVTYPDASFGYESRAGVPFIFLLRDILQYDYTVDDSITRMINAQRTCDLILGVGDGKLNKFRGFEYSYSTLKVFDDQNMEPHTSYHPRISNVVYWGMDWLCPAYDIVLSDQINKYYGKLTPQVGIQYLTAVEKSGSNHAAYYDLTNLHIYVSFAANHTVGGYLDAYDRQFTFLDLNKIFAETLN